MSQGVTAHDLPVCGPYSLLVLVLTLWIHQVGGKIPTYSLQLYRRGVGEKIKNRI